ncbi:MAG: ABC transporter ATP-binding protein [Candidatus Izemoplasmatales bacterium]|jgi:ATP-binding cassette subfamily B protein|nr:ABC transporter ATP-binding protein [Candidatus Izemoplasmatales bacterium]HPD99629.1 ABC transporter ATP-binding protein [Bacillota bacterium]
MLFGKHINKYYLKYGIFFLIGLAALVVVDFVQLEIPNIIGTIIDGLELKTLAKEDVVVFVKDIAIFGLIIVGGRFLWRIFIFGTSWRIDFDLRNKMFAHAEKLSQTYYSEKKSGGLMALFINDLNAIRMAFGPGLLMLFDIIILGTLAFYRMFTLDRTITYFAAIPLALIAVMATYISKITGKKFKARQQAFEDLSDFTQENFYGISVIKAFVNEVREIRAFAKINKRNQDKNVSYIKASTFLHIAVEMFINIIRVTMLGVGAYLVYKTINTNDVFSIGDLTRYIAYFGTLIWPMMAIGRLINMRAQAKASLDRVSAFLNAEVEIHDEKEVVNVEKIEGKITFNNLTFRYPKTEKDVLKNINFVIEKGQTVGIIGRTGSGKTTLVDLLLRLYNLKTCELLIDDTDIMKLPIKTIRDAIGYVPQENFIFSDVIRNNISFAKDEADQELIKQMAIYSDIHDNIVDFPNQYDTMVGERGVTLSGGQKQRISIARALLKNPEILIMDDSFSAVDTKTEEQVISNLRELRKGKTTIIIAHRISTIKSSDQIIFIENGEVMAKGTHEELLKSCELYRKMVIHQRLEAELEGEVE